ncbi:MAG: dTDP-4-dehydrorhamnose reductase [Rhodobacteraceae bacterium]|jgi:dTDP-4-dehydrorhamnose reductase|nr:dTDP-4-dehydrorhamnose reductase [uncultured Defluviimonas sp.]MCB2125327.1 dTDP-4-dehydrorhamnose reductase [Paracoccaceae bacterium]MCC0069612.1 dTDP-4-dehydrorhamnose reductase [Paracoccaceae bacterium]
MKALVFGTTGQLGIELARTAPRGTLLLAFGREAADLAHPETCAALVATTDVDVVINAAAYTAVDAAETDRETAHLVNAEAPGAMARAAARRAIPFLHVSTDYVFDGSGTRPWREEDPVAPLGVYGQTKLAGERAIIAADGPHAILRTSWVFSAHGRNFVKTMLRLAAERETLSVVDDQRGGPTAAADIAVTLWTVARAFAEGRGSSGVFHYAGAPTVSWAGFAEAVLAASALARRPSVRRIASADYPTPARRPANSALDCARIRATYGIEQPDWRASLARVIRELEATA